MRGLEAWKTLTPRDRFLVKGLALFLLGGLVFQALWQPARQRVASAERYHQQQLVVMRQLQNAQPQRAVQATSQPLASRISESAAAAGLDLQQIEVESEQLRLTVNGDAHPLLRWLEDLEREAGSFQMLTLEKREGRLEARLVL
jgi:general secretion pathway protein M